MLCFRDHLLYDDHLPSAEKFSNHGCTWGLDAATGALSTVNRIPGDRPSPFAPCRAAME
jgi:hypothetical protein